MNKELIKPNFTPKTDLKEYTSKKRAGDGQALLYLTEDWFWKRVFEPLTFFNTLYEQVAIVIINRSNPLLVERHLLSLKLDKAQLMYLLKYISSHLDDKISNNSRFTEPLDFENIRMLQDCKELMDIERRKLFIDLYENEKKDIDNPNNRYDCAREMKHLETLPDIYAKHKYLVELVNQYNRNAGTWEEYKRWDGESFLGMFTRERDKYKVLIDAEKSSAVALKENISEPDPEQIMHYPLKTQNIFCEAMPIEVAINHFKILTEEKSKNNKPFLTIEQLNLFIDKAFIGKTEIGQQSINYSSREKQFIISRFYQFYLNIGIYKNYENSNQCRSKYIRLLTDNFHKWNFEQVLNNFARPVIREWKVL